MLWHEFTCHSKYKLKMCITELLVPMHYYFGTTYHVPMSLKVRKFKFTWIWYWHLHHYYLLVLCLPLVSLSCWVLVPQSLPVHAVDLSHLSPVQSPSHAVYVQKRYPFKMIVQLRTIRVTLYGIQFTCNICCHPCRRRNPPGTLPNVFCPSPTN